MSSWTFSSHFEIGVHFAFCVVFVGYFYLFVLRTFYRMHQTSSHQYQKSCCLLVTYSSKCIHKYPLFSRSAYVSWYLFIGRNEIECNRFMFTGKPFNLKCKSCDLYASVLFCWIRNRHLNVCVFAFFCWFCMCVSAYVLWPCTVHCEFSLLKVGSKWMNTYKLLNYWELLEATGIFSCGNFTSALIFSGAVVHIRQCAENYL